VFLISIPGASFTLEPFWHQGESPVSSHAYIDVYTYIHKKLLNYKRIKNSQSLSTTQTIQAKDKVKRYELLYQVYRLLIIIIIWFMRLLTLRPLLAYCVSLG
jgi:hypothetical protein